MLADKVGLFLAVLFMISIHKTIFLVAKEEKKCPNNIGSTFNFTQEFKGYENTSENWVLSITALSGAFNGTTRTYMDGVQ